MEPVTYANEPIEETTDPDDVRHEVYAVLRRYGEFVRAARDRDVIEYELKESGHGVDPDDPTWAAWCEYAASLAPTQDETLPFETFAASTRQDLTHGVR